MVLGVMHTISISLPWHPLLAAVMVFIVGFLVVRVFMRIWDLVGF